MNYELDEFKNQIPKLNLEKALQI